MDPNETLKRLREVMESIAAFEDEPGTPDREVVELFEALDQWLSRGGFLPEAWASSANVYAVVTRAQAEAWGCPESDWPQLAGQALEVYRQWAEGEVYGVVVVNADTGAEASVWSVYDDAGCDLAARFAAAVRALEGTITLAPGPNVPGSIGETDETGRMVWRAAPQAEDESPMAW